MQTKEENDSDWQYMEANSVSPEYMEMLWADGWRHFGSFFFRQKVGLNQGSLTNIIPLRINVNEFSPSKSQRKIIRQNKKTKVIFRDAFIDEEKEAIFDEHVKRFKENVPNTIFDFVDKDTANVPCHTMECCLYHQDKLYAVSFFDIGKYSNSSIYAMFLPDFGKYSPGLFTLLEELRFARSQDKQYLYTGYAYTQSSHYDYKKKFKGTEFYDWRNPWKSLEKVNEYKS